MRHIILGLLFLLPLNIFSQSAFNIIKVSKNSFKPSIVCRSITTQVANAALAKEILRTQQVITKPIYTNVNRKVCIPEIRITYKFLTPQLTYPERLYGGYNYLKLLSRLSHNKLIDKNFLHIWKNINRTQTYNGVHHIVNKSTLQEIYLRANLKGRVRLDEMQNNAPAVFHSLHGNPTYKDIFHNRDKQVETYFKYGMKAVIDDFFNEVSIASRKEGVRFFSKEVIENTYKEAHLWCNTFNCKWE